MIKRRKGSVPMKACWSDAQNCEMKNLAFDTPLPPFLTPSSPVSWHLPLKAAVAYGSGPVCSPSLQGHHNMHTHLRVDFHFSQISSGLNLTFQRTWLRSHSLLWSLLHNYPSPTLQKLGMAFTCPPELQRSLALEHSRVLESVLRI